MRVIDPFRPEQPNAWKCCPEHGCMYPPYGNCWDCLKDWKAELDDYSK